MDFILALDQGTTSSRAILFDRAGHVVARAQREFRQFFPKPGWVEHDADEIWQSQLAVARTVLQQVPGATKRVAAIGITNQRETTVLWDRKTGRPVAPAIVWQDRRTADHCEQLKARGLAPRIQKKTGLLLDAYFSATKLAWLLDHIPNAREQAEDGQLAFGTIDSWLIWNLTGGRVHATDASNASRTMLFDMHTLQWDTELLKLFSIPRAVLPAVVASSGVLGVTDSSLLGIAVPIAGVAGDQQAATFGQTCFAPGMAKNTYGTGCFMLMNTGTRVIESRHQLLSTVAWVGPSSNSSPKSNSACYAIEGSVFMAGATVQWLRDGLKVIPDAGSVETLAASVPDVDDVYLVPAFTGLGAPHWDAYARASIVGMNRGTTHAHIARAALESIALQTVDVFDAMAADAGFPLTELRVDGGASSNNLLLQMQADFLGVPVVRPKVTETTALGAAYLAGLATGFWSGAPELMLQWEIDRKFEPNMQEAQRRAKRSRWQEALGRARGWARP